MARGDKFEKTVDIDELFRRHQRNLRNIYRQDSARLIRDFVACFEYKNGRAKLSFRPDDSMLEVLGEAFGRYWNAKGSLDAAFGTRQVGRGRRSAREQERIRIRRFSARAAYDELRRNNVPQKLAIKIVANRYRRSEENIRSLIFR
jgi:hypothetical protein